MANKRKPRVRSAGHNRNIHTEKNIADLRKTQSPWADVPADNRLADVVRRTRADVDRLVATSADDRRFFDENPDRRFYLREATPHERDTGVACGWVCVARYSTGRLRLPIPLPQLACRDASEHDTEELAGEFFDWLTAHFTAENAHPFLFGVIEEIRGVSHG